MDQRFVAGEVDGQPRQQLPYGHVAIGRHGPDYTNAGRREALRGVQAHTPVLDVVGGVAEDGNRLGA